MSLRHIVVTLPAVLARDGAFVWRHGPQGPWFRDGEDIVFPLHDAHPEWQRIGLARLPELRAQFPDDIITIRTPGGLSICGAVPDQAPPR